MKPETWNRIHLVMIIIEAVTIIFMGVFTIAFMKYGFTPKEFMPEWARIILGL